ncbi:MAG: hypothetical protein LBH59_01065 [Planctomycetaceae bacterium]|nr:hypothetical protein [Planctomycetaceae bacterium]
MGKRVICPTIPKPVWAVGFAHEQTFHVVALAVFSFLILKRLQHKLNEIYLIYHTSKTM